MDQVFGTVAGQAIEEGAVTLYESPQGDKGPLVFAVTGDMPAGSLKGILPARCWIGFPICVWLITALFITGTTISR